MLSDTNDKYYVTVLGATPEIEQLFVNVDASNTNVVVGYYTNEHPSDKEIRALEIKEFPIFIVFDTEREVFRTNDVFKVNKYLVDKTKLATNEKNYVSVRKAAWDYLKEKDWNKSAKEEWESAVVSKTVANDDYELLDKSYNGKEALSVTFADKDNVVVGTPTILVDRETNKVIGHMPGE